MTKSAVISLMAPMLLTADYVFDQEQAINTAIAIYKKSRAIGH